MMVAACATAPEVVISAGGGGNGGGIGTREEKGPDGGFIFVSTVSQFYRISACIQIAARYIDHY